MMIRLTENVITPDVAIALLLKAIAIALLLKAIESIQVANNVSKRVN